MLEALEAGFLDGVYIFGAVWGFGVAFIILLFTLGIFSGVSRLVNNLFRLLNGK